MKRLMNDMLLYHGSYCEVNTPDLSRCAMVSLCGRT